MWKSLQDSFVQTFHLENSGSTDFYMNKIGS